MSRTLRSCVFLVVLAAGVGVAQEKKPGDSTEVVATGCIKGRVFTAMDNPEEQGAVMRGRNLSGRSFRISAKRDVMDEVKKHDRHFVEVTGLVRTSDLDGRGPGLRIGGTNVNIGVAPMDPTRPAGTQQALTNVVVMDITAVRFVAESCPK